MENKLNASEYHLLEEALRFQKSMGWVAPKYEAIIEKARQFGYIK